MHPRRRRLFVANRHRRRPLAGAPVSPGRAEEESQGPGNLEHVPAQEPFQGRSAVYQCRIRAYG